MATTKLVKKIEQELKQGYTNLIRQIEYEWIKPFVDPKFQPTKEEKEIMQHILDLINNDYQEYRNILLDETAKSLKEETI